MACGIKTIYCVRDLLPTKTRLLLLIALVISHLLYSSVLLNGISQSLISALEKQLNWGIKACFNRYKMDSAHDLRLYHRILSVRHLLDLKAFLFFWKWKYNLSPAFSRLQIATAILKTHERTLNLTYHGFANSEQLENSLFKRVVPLWNALPERLKLGNQTYENVKKRLKKFFLLRNLSMTLIDLSIVRNVGVNIVSSSLILMLNICFHTIFVMSIFLIIRFYTALHIFWVFIYEGIQCFLFFYLGTRRY